MSICPEKSVVTLHRPQFAPDLHQTWSIYVVRSISYVYSFWCWWRHRWRHQDPKHGQQLHGRNSVDIWVTASNKSSKCRVYLKLLMWHDQFPVALPVQKIARGQKPEVHILIFYFRQFLRQQKSDYMSQFYGPNYVGFDISNVTDVIDDVTGDRQSGFSRAVIWEAITENSNRK